MITLAAALILAVAAHAQPTSESKTAPKVLRYAFPTAETGFDPARIVDLYSRIVTSHIFEGLYAYDHLARPIKVKPLIADGMPESSADFRTWTVRIKPGIYFADDPAFGGKKREVTAQDFVYAYKRPVDPGQQEPDRRRAARLQVHRAGRVARRRDQEQEAVRLRQADRGHPGTRPLRRSSSSSRSRVRASSRPWPRATCSVPSLARWSRSTATRFRPTRSARGPFKLTQWRRSSLIVLERNPDYREVLYDAEPAPDDAEGQAILKQFKGKRLPMVDRVEVSIIQETQPRWLAFLNGQIDYINVPGEFVSQGMPNGKVAPHLAKKGVRGFRVLNPDSAFTYFNMEDPVVGGYTPEKVALRRAISLGMDVERDIRIVRRGQAVPAQSVVVPHTIGYDPKFKSENGDFDPARAKALLDVYGYVDRDGDGWRDLPDGKPLVLEVATQPDQLTRQFDELWQKNMERIGIRVKFFTGQWPEQLKAARAGKLMLWSLGSSAAGSDGQGALSRLYGPQSGSQNLARFKNDEFDAIYLRMQEIADGPERDALFEKAKLISVAYMPYKTTVHRFSNDLVHPWLQGYRRPLFWNEWWHVVDIDNAKRPPR